MGKAKEAGLGDKGSTLQGAHRGSAQAPGHGRQPELNSVFLGREHGWIPLIVSILCGSYSVMELWPCSLPLRRPPDVLARVSTSFFETLFYNYFSFSGRLSHCT